MATHFVQLNRGWNAEPNAPRPRVELDGSDVVLEFEGYISPLPRYPEGQRLRLRFARARRYRLGPTNDEGWYMGQCRFSGIAPAWGELYEVSGDLKLDACPRDWRELRTASAPGRHFLFYLRDDTFECEADDWRLEQPAAQGR